MFACGRRNGFHVVLARKINLILYILVKKFYILLFHCEWQWNAAFYGILLFDSGNQFSVPWKALYLHAESTTSGMWTNTIENGAITIGSVELTWSGSKGGMFPAGSTLRTSPFRSMVWLCKFPSFAVRWYSSLLTAPVEAWGIRITFLLWVLCLCLRLHVLLNAMLAWTVLLPSRLISSNVIPFCSKENAVRWHGEDRIFLLALIDSSSFGLDRFLSAMGVRSYLLACIEACRKSMLPH